MTKGITGLLDHRKGGNSAKLTAVQIETLRHWLYTYTPAQILGPDPHTGDGAFWTVPDLVRLVQERFDVVHKSANSYRALFKRCGLSRQRPSHYYKSRNEQAVMAFEEALKKTD